MIQQAEFEGFPVAKPQDESVLVRLVRFTNDRGPLVPQSLLPEALGISKSRVSQLLKAGRFEVVQVGEAIFIPASEVERFVTAPKTKGGRGHKVILAKAA